jgi:cytochrome c oxidase subunit 2
MIPRRPLRAAPLALCPAARADLPLDYMHTQGPAADPLTALGWGVTLLSLLVTAIVAALLLGALLRRRPRPRAPSGLPSVARDTGGIDWVYIGTGLSAAVLFGITLWTFATLGAVATPKLEPGLTIAVIGHQWWWEIRYAGAAGGFSTANEIHIPTGRPVRIELASADVIHSFWVPKLAGKTDTIPGQTNIAWLQADRPGVYQGQCAEYCGMQHAHMALQVVAEPPGAFEAWRDGQGEAASAPPAGAGQEAFMARCGLCHTVRGTGARGNLGPDLTHLMGRRRIASGLLPNTIGNLGGWVADAQVQKPGCFMPSLELPGPELQAILAYLQTLR